MLLRFQNDRPLSSLYLNSHTVEYMKPHLLTPTQGLNYPVFKFVS